MVKPGDMREPQWLRPELSRWVEQGLITPDQAARIVASYAVSQQKRADWFRQIVLSGLTILAAVLVAAAVISWIAARWDELSQWERFQVVLAGWAATYLALLLWRAWAGQWLGRELVQLAIAFFFPLVIAQLALFQNVDLPGRVLVFLWAFGLLPLVVGLCGEGVGVLFCALIAIWVWGDPFGLFDMGAGQETPAVGDLLRFYSFPLLWLAGAIVYGKRGGVALFIFLAALTAWLVSLPRFWPPYLTEPLTACQVGFQMAFYMAIVGTGLVAAGLRTVRAEPASSFLLILGTFCVAIAVAPLGSIQGYIGSVVDAAESPHFSWAALGWWLALIFCLFAATMAGSVFADATFGETPFWRNSPRAILRRLTRGLAGPFVFATFFTLLLILEPVRLSLEGPIRFELLVFEWLCAIVISLGWVSYLLVEGYRQNRSVLLTLGMLTFIVWLGSRFVDIFGLELRQAAAVFASAGIALGSVVFLLRKAGRAIGRPTQKPEEGAPEGLPAGETTFRTKLPLASPAALSAGKTRGLLLASALWQAGVFGAFPVWQWWEYPRPIQLVELPILGEEMAPGRSLFHGWYLMLTFPISEFECTQIEGIDWSQALRRSPDGSLTWYDPEELGRLCARLRARPVFLSFRLAGDNKLEVTRISLDRPAGGLYLTGAVRNYRLLFDADGEWESRCTGCMVRLAFGIERYWVREGEMARWRETIRAGKVRAKVEVAANGRCRLLELRD